MAIARVLVLRTAGTNCDREMVFAFKLVGAQVDLVHFNALLDNPRQLQEYQILVIPGGFSYGDDIAAGKILAVQLRHHLPDQLAQFIQGDKLVLGVCNGFQVLIESGLLPGSENNGEVLKAALGTNVSSKFEDRWVYLKRMDESRCIFTSNTGGLVRMPVAHGEGKLILPPDEEERLLNELKEKGQIVYKYAMDDGSLALGSYPENPNGSIADIAGICNPSGSVFGLMPHPERAFQRITYPDWTRTGLEEVGDGFSIFKNMVDYVAKKF